MDYNSGGTVTTAQHELLMQVQHENRDEEYDCYVNGEHMRLEVVNGRASAAHGRIASHTGFQSLSGAMIAYQGDADDLAREKYLEYKKMAYVVWEEHKEHGWKALSDGWYTDRLYFKIPTWASKSMKKGLKDIGCELACKLNSHWLIPEGATKDQARELLKPILSPGTRLKDEDELVKELKIAFASSDFNNMQVQGSLF